MDGAVFKSFIKALIDIAPQSTQNLLFSWHGGEPLAVGAAFFCDVFRESAILAKHNYIVQQAVQTNGTLINDEFARIFLDHSVSVCVSIDGPKKYHNKARRYRNGKGTFAKTMAGIEILQKHNIEFASISVISEEHLHDLEGYFSFMASLGVDYVGLMMPEIEGVNKASFLSQYSDRDIVNFWNDVIAQAVKYNIRVRELDYPLLHLVTPTEQHATTIPFSFLNLAYDGRYSTFDPELMGQTMLDGSQFLLGNITGDIKADWAKFEKSRIYGDIVGGVTKCRETCQYFSICGGGPIGNKLFENGSFDSTETLACRFRIKRVVDALLMLSEREDEVVDRYVNMMKPCYAKKDATASMLTRGLNS